MSCIGSAMYGLEHARWFARNLPPDVFYRPAHRTIAREIHECVKANLQPDIVVLIARLRDREVLHEIGNEDYLIQLAEYVPSPASLRHYGAQLLDYAVKRRLEDRCREMVHTIHDPEESVDTMLGKAFMIGRNLPRIGTDTVMSGDVDVESLAQRRPGITTPWPSLNFACRGSGFYFGETALIVGHRGIGKTGILVQSVLEAAKEGHKPFYATLEMSAEDIVLRMVQSICGMTKAPSNTIDFVVWDDAVRLVKKLNIPIYDPRKMIGGDRSVEKLCSWAEDVKSTLGCDCGVIDYGQKLTHKGKSENRTREMDYCADAIDDLAKQTGYALVIGSQRSIDSHNKNDWRSKDSIKWEDNAALVLQIRRARTETEGKLYVAKNRHGQEPVIDVTFQGSTVRHIEDDPYA